MGLSGAAAGAGAAARVAFLAGAAALAGRLGGRRLLRRCGQAQVAVAPVAGDPVVRDALAQQVQRLDRHCPHAPGLVQAELGLDGRLVAGQPVDRLAAVAPAGAPADFARLQQPHVVAARSQVQRRRQAGQATADHGPRRSSRHRTAARSPRRAARWRRSRSSAPVVRRRPERAYAQAPRLRAPRIVSTMRSMCSRSMISGGDIAMMSPVVRISTPFS